MSPPGDQSEWSRDGEERDLKRRSPHRAVIPDPVESNRRNVLTDPKTLTQTSFQARLPPAPAPTDFHLDGEGKGEHTEENCLISHRTIRQKSRLKRQLLE